MVVKGEYSSVSKLKSGLDWVSPGQGWIQKDQCEPLKVKETGGQLHVLKSWMFSLVGLKLFWTMIVQ